MCNKQFSLYVCAQHQSLLLPQQSSTTMAGVSATETQNQWLSSFVFVADAHGRVQIQKRSCSNWTFLDGHWSTGSNEKVAIADGNCTAFSSFEVVFGYNFCKLEANGGHHLGSVDLSRSEIRWCDGDVWRRCATPMPISTRKKRVRSDQEVVPRGSVALQLGQEASKGNITKTHWAIARSMWKRPRFSKPLLLYSANVTRSFVDLLKLHSLPRTAQVMIYCFLVTPDKKEHREIRELWDKQEWMAMRPWNAQQHSGLGCES